MCPMRMMRVSLGSLAACRHSLGSRWLVAAAMQQPKASLLDRQRRGFRSLANTTTSLQQQHMRESGNLRLSGTSTIAPPARSSRLRKSPYFEKTVEAGAANFTVYNRMLMPLDYGNAQVEYHALTQDVAIWDVAAERQVEICGPDALKLAQLMTPRDLSAIPIGQGVYAIMCDEDGTVINDPVALNLGDNKWWFSIADSDVLLWARANALGFGLDVKVTEPDVSPLAIQGPRSVQLARELFGSDVVDGLKYFQFTDNLTVDGDIPVLLARSGWSPERGYELYLKDSSKGERLWDMVMKKGEKYNIRPGAPNQPRRVEAGMLSFGGDTLSDTNALELGLPKRFVNPDAEHNFIGKAALQRIASEGVKRRFVGFRFEADAAVDATIDALWRGKHRPVSASASEIAGWKVDSPPLFKGSSDSTVGMLTAVSYSPRFECTLGLGFISNQVNEGAEAMVEMSDGVHLRATIEKLPFRSAESSKLAGRSHVRSENITAFERDGELKQMVSSEAQPRDAASVQVSS